jgi:hypothetical protein
MSCRLSALVHCRIQFRTGKAKAAKQYKRWKEAVWRIRDVYPGSRILIFSHPGSRIQKQQQKTGVKKNFSQTIFCSHKFHKTEYYLIFDKLKKKIWPNFQELLKFLPKKLSPSHQKYGFGIRDPRSGIRKKPIPDPGSRGQKGTGSRIRIRNTGKKVPIRYGTVSHRHRRDAFIFWPALSL